MEVDKKSMYAKERGAYKSIRNMSGRPGGLTLVETFGLAEAF